MITTLNKIRSHKPCRDGWEKLLRHLGKTAADDAPLAITTVLDSNGLSDALWCLRAVEARDREIQLYAVWCARQVQHLMSDPRSVATLDVAERFARGRATDEELRAAAQAAAAATAAPGAAARAKESAWASWTAAAAARAAAAGDVAWATDAAEAAAAQAAWETRTAVYASSCDAMKAAQADELRRICQEIEAGRDPYPEEDGR